MPSGVSFSTLPCSSPRAVLVAPSAGSAPRLANFQPVVSRSLSYQEREMGGGGRDEERRIEGTKCENGT